MGIKKFVYYFTPSTDILVISQYYTIYPKHPTGNTSEMTARAVLGQDKKGRFFFVHLLGQVQVYLLDAIREQAAKNKATSKKRTKRKPALFLLAPWSTVPKIAF